MTPLTAPRPPGRTWPPRPRSALILRRGAPQDKESPCHLADGALPHVRGGDGVVRNIVRAGRIAGIEIRVDSSWVVIALLITYSMYLPFLFKGLSTGAAVGIAIQVRQLLRGVQAQDVIASDLVRIPPDLALQDAVDHYFVRYDHGSFPVDEYGRTIGLPTLRKVRRVPSDQWPASRVRDHMVPLGGQVVVPPDAPMDQVMARLEDGEAGRVPAADDGEVVGIITPSDLTRWLRRRRTLDGRALDSRSDRRNLDRRY
jgi:CBS domain-containing protein